MSLKVGWEGFGAECLGVEDTFETKVSFSVVRAGGKMAVGRAVQGGRGGWCGGVGLKVGR